MKNPSFKRNFGNRFILLLIFLLIELSSCNFIDKVLAMFNNKANDTNQLLDQAYNGVVGNAENYANIMQEVIDKLDDQNVKNQMENVLDKTNKLLITGSTEMRCNIQFSGDYLSKRIKAIKAQFNKKPLPKEEPKVCTIIPSIIDMNRRANDRNNIEVTGYFLKEDISKYKLFHYVKNGLKSNKTSNLSVSTDFQLVINLGSSGITLNKNSSKLVLMWKNEIISEIPVIQKQVEPCRTRERTFTGFPKLVVYPTHKKHPWVKNKKRGDKDFYGNGPCTEGYVSIFTRNNGKELWARAKVKMWECPRNISKTNGDFTYGDKEMEIKLANADSGWRIKTIKESTTDQFQSIDRKTDQTEKLSGGGPVSLYLIQGDTSGKDLGSSRVEISFKSIKVTLEELGDCVSKR